MPETKDQSSSGTEVLRADSFNMRGGRVHLNRFCAENYAEAWFEDAVAEARKKKDPNALRREIVFAVCFAESYLFEWVRDVVLKEYSDWNDRVVKLQEYFLQEKESITERWKSVLMRLKEDGLLVELPNFGRQSSWGKFTNLVKHFRDGLVHGPASLPCVTIQPKGTEPFPTPDDLKKKPHGWAVGIVNQLVEDLHSVVGVSAPEWWAKRPDWRSK